MSMLKRGMATLLLTLAAVAFAAPAEAAQWRYVGYYTSGAACHADGKLSGLPYRCDVAPLTGNYFLYVYS
ncbi:hypothetical protein [Marinactinospora rubrisoli]|uniref:Secreted protein n=1 Tax=Marinactinospora rubrisoli TaxID=2715399 RepID=A0ABW2KP19_9ACTN